MKWLYTLCSRVHTVKVLYYAHVHTGFLASFQPNTFLYWKHTDLVSRAHDTVRKAGGGKEQAPRKSKGDPAKSREKQKEASGTDVECLG